jgi:hypothetical protein
MKLVWFYGGLWLQEANTSLALSMLDIQYALRGFVWVASLYLSVIGSDSLHS